jgi:hypothetical protein
VKPEQHHAKGCNGAHVESESVGNASLRFHPPVLPPTFPPELNYVPSL